jgi:hypothetical protein
LNKKDYKKDLLFVILCVISCYLFLLRVIISISSSHLSLLGCYSCLALIVGELDCLLVLLVWCEVNLRGRGGVLTDSL